ncbi:hypothetical protein F8M41_001196 [Gigaspora margarita]|uniref:Uncharacterized protein n=1 Tax=Gigaspora margarita TaxID=4874 RepID=A0A8H3XFH0_GIGMA|nr:hypothetical protein F8M41_001196 [Gigaspora margarita]
MGLVIGISFDRLTKVDGNRFQFHRPGHLKTYYVINHYMIIVLTVWKSILCRITYSYECECRTHFDRHKVIGKTKCWHRRSFSQRSGLGNEIHGKGACHEEQSFRTKIRVS